jgi:hypothetical protein
MALPRFTADTALGRARGRYRGTSQQAGAAGLVAPQMMEGDDPDAGMEDGDEGITYEFDDDGE